MIQRIFFVLTILALATFGKALCAQYNVEIPTMTAPVVVELFTSQSCSSCPPADRILAQLAEKDNIIALGCHVSYWDHLHWKDTVSQDFCDMRQHGYAGQRGTKRIFTPQMVVNGQDEFVGSHANKIKTALEKARSVTIKPIDINIENPDLVTFSLPSMKDKNYRLWAFGYQKFFKQDISSGENRGKSVPYVNSAITYTNLGGWSGDAISKSFALPEPPTENKLDGIIIFAQIDGYGEIAAAGKIEF